MLEGADMMPQRGQMPAAMRLSLMEKLNITQEHYDLIPGNLVHFSGVDISRVSTLLICIMAAGNIRRTLNPYGIAVEISALEKGTRSPTKSPGRFTGPALSNYFHTHICVPSPEQVFKNVLNQNRCRDEDALMQKIEVETKRRINCGEPIREAAEKVVRSVIQEGLNQRWNNQQITGHWLIYAQYKDSFYYLAAWPHSRSQDEDRELAEIIRIFCSDEFPFLFSEEVA